MSTLLTDKLVRRIVTPLFIVAPLVFSGCEEPPTSQSSFSTDLAPARFKIWTLSASATQAFGRIGLDPPTIYPLTHWVFFDSTLSINSESLTAVYRFSTQPQYFDVANTRFSLFAPPNKHFHRNRFSGWYVENEYRYALDQDYLVLRHRYDIWYFKNLYAKSLVPDSLTSRTWTLVSASDSLVKKAMSDLIHTLRLTASNNFTFNSKFRADSSGYRTLNGLYGINTESDTLQPICLMPDQPNPYQYSEDIVLTQRQETQLIYELTQSTRVQMSDTTLILSSALATFNFIKNQDN